MVQSQEPARKCPECACETFIQIHETGEEVCASCGLVDSYSSIDFGPEWRSFTHQQRENLPRTGAPINLLRHDNGLSTVIGWRDVDGTGKKMSQSQTYKFQRLRKWNNQTGIRGSKQRNLASALDYINHMGNELNLPRNVIETASSIYRNIMKTGVLRGRSIQCLAASAIYAACRQCNLVRTLDDIAKYTEYSKKEIARTYRFLHQKSNTDIPLFSHINYISKFVSQLGLCGETEMIALKLLEKASEQHLTVGRSPRSITASCIYIACELTSEKRNQSEVAKVAQVTEVTIRNRYKEIINKINFEITI